MKRYFYFSLILLTACLGKKTAVNEVTEPTKPSEEISKQEPPATNRLGKINFFLETSASMAGYFKGSSDFVRTIPNVLVDIEGKILNDGQPLQINFIADSIVPFRGNTQSFIRAISTTKVASSKSSEMHRIFEMVANSTKSNEISLLVSDCILSYPDEDIKRNSQINREKAAGGLKADIKATFNKLKKRNIGASMFAFNSSFTGTYYTYENNKLILKDETRPYYLWVIGDKDLVANFKSRLVRLPSLSYFQTIDFGLHKPTIAENAHEIFFSYQRIGNWRVNGKGVAMEGETKPATLAVGLNLRGLPDYVQKVEYLNKNLKGLSSNGKFKIKSVRSAKDIDKSKLKPNEMKVALNSTHVVVVEAISVYTDNAFLKLYLPAEVAKDYRSLSIMDDRSPELLNGKTFALEHLIDGVREAYNDPNTSYINITIPFKK